MKIPLVDLVKQYQNIKPEIMEALSRVLDDAAFIQGKYVQDFENAFSSMLNTENTIGCSSGTSALFLSLKALGIQPGDEVITSTLTFIATVEAIVETGATPVLVDIDPVSYNLDLDQVESSITSKTKAIIPVHIYGNPVNMDRLMSIARKNNLQVVEDCAQAHMAKYNNKFVGTFGDTGCFSFYPGKNLGAYGDAGAVITSNGNLTGVIRKMLNHGRAEKYLHDTLAYNHRMDGIQGAVLSVKMKYIQQWTEQRRAVAAQYNSILKDIEKVIIPQEGPLAKHVYHLYVIQVDNRDKVLKTLNQAGIEAGIHYPVPIHLQPAMQVGGYQPGDFPVAEKICSRVISLPMFPEIKEVEISYITDILKKAVN